MPSGTLFRAGILAASVLVATAALLLPYPQNDSESPNEDYGYGEYTAAPSSVARLGAAAYFPQGTNPPVGSQLEGEPNVSGNITLDGAVREGDVVTAFGTFVEGEPECALMSSEDIEDGAVVESESEVEIAADAFLFTAKLDNASTSSGLYVRCVLAGRPADVAEREVSG